MRVSIIIPTFNYDRYIARAIRSCIEQSLPKSDFEIIVINDSSKDSTKYILASYGHWIRVIEHTTNHGLPYSRNQGIMNAKGDYVVNLDADDYLHTDYLKVCLLYMDFNHYDAVGTDYFLVDDNENIIKKVSMYENPIACGIMFRKQQMIEAGLYDTQLHIGEDVDFRIRFDKRYKVERIDLPLYRYRMHKNNSTCNAMKNQQYLDKIAQKNECVINHSYHAEVFSKDTD